MSKLAKVILGGVVLLLSSALMTGCLAQFGPAKSGLQVITTDVPASIFLNGQYLEKTPYIGKDLKPGEYLLKIQPDGPEYVPYETTVSLKKGLLTVVTWKPGSRPETSGGVIYEMEQLTSKKKTEVSFISIPDKAVISFDQEKKDFTPLLVENISPGTHEFEIKLPSYDSQKHTINVIEGYRINITVKLAKQNLEIASATPETTDDTTPATSSATPVRSTAEPTPTNTNSPHVTITSTNFFQDGVEVLRVRDKAGSGQEIGFAQVGKSYPYLNQTVGGWYKIEFSGKEGWVSGKYATLKE